MSKKSGVFARDMKTKEQAEILNPKLVYSLTTTGKKKYRLTGVSEAGTKLSVFIGEDVAKKFGKGVEVKPKPRAARKTCEEKFDECKAKRKPAGTGKRGRPAKAKDEAAEDAVEEVVEDAVEEAEKAVKKLKRGAKKASPEVVAAAEELADAAEELADAVDEAPKKAVRKAAPKKAVAKKAAPKKAVAKKAAPKRAGAKKAAPKRAAKK